MGKSCSIIPKIKNKNGELVDSRLYKGLLSFTKNDRSRTNDIYLRTKTDAFAAEFLPGMQLDENDEPLISSLFTNTNIKNVISELEILEQLNKEIGHFKKNSKEVKTWPITTENWHILSKECRKFNNYSEFRNDYYADIVVTKEQNNSENSFYTIQVFKGKQQNVPRLHKISYNESLYEKITDLLSHYGVSIGALTDLEERMGINGVTEFDKAKNIAEGTVELIRLAKGEKGKKALPEEFAHFVIEAMGNDPLTNRLINYLVNNNLVQEILGDEYTTYKTAYKNDEYKLAKEAAGKLLAKHFLNNETTDKKPYKNILERVISAVKNFFSKIKASDIQRAMLETDKEFSTFAKDILGGRLDDKIKLSNIHTSEKFFNLDDRINRDKVLLQSIIDTELKRLKIYKQRNNTHFDVSQTLFINTLEMALDENNEIEGIYIYLSKALKTLSDLSTKLAMLNGETSSTINDKAKVLRDIKNYLHSYISIVSDIRSALLDEEKFADNRYGAKIREAVNQVTNLVEDLRSDYIKYSMPLFVDFIKPVIGDSIEIPFGKWKGKKFTTEELLKEANRDISIFDRWLDSMAESSDVINRVLDQKVKTAKSNARLATIDIQKQLQAATVKLKQADYSNQDWMFEKDEEGNLTGEYISQIDNAAFKKAMGEMFTKLREKYGIHPMGQDALNFARERQAWFEENMEYIDDKRMPKVSKYASKEFRELSAAQKEYYETIMEIKRSLDNLIPEDYTHLTNAVKIRKDLIERVKASKDVKDGTKQIWENIKDDFIRRSDDEGFGDKAAVKDFEGRAVQTLPVYYTKLKEGESANDISTDIVSTLTAYAAMANDYNQLSQIVDILEVGRDILRGREVTQTQGDKELVEKFRVDGRKIVNKLTKSGDKTQFMQRINDFFEMQVYGRYLADEGTFGNSKIDKGKVYNFINKATALSTYALNALSGISNIATGTVMMRIESFCGEFFTESNTLRGDRNYAQALPEYLAQIGSSVKTSKLALWDELFNVMQDYEQETRDLHFNRSRFAKLFNSSSLYFMNNVGEHWMQNRTSLALADAYKMKSPDGKIVSLWDAMEVVYTDPNNKELGAKLQVKQGYTKEDGTEFTKDDIIKFSRRSAAINQRLHGIYNQEDKSAIQRLGIGRMAIMFRKWIKPSLNRRFAEGMYNYDLDAWTEGYYRTAGRFMWQLAKDLKAAEFNISTRWNELSGTEKANIKRALTEVAHYLAIVCILGLIDWDDQDDRPWLAAMAEYQLRRLKTEVGVLLPGPSMVREGLRIVQSPAAGINTIEHMLDLTALLNPANYMDEIQSGRYKGHSTAYKSFFESPLVPMNKTIYRGLHPEEGVAFFKQ
jgi:hypothetical protein